MRTGSFFFITGVLILLALAVPGVMAADSAQTGYIVVGLSPVAQFDAHYAFSTIPTRVDFVDNSLGSTPLSYSWDFGDGATSTEQNPSHMYNARGTYTVKLTVTNQYGTSTAIKKDFISIGMAPAPDFTASPTSGNVPLAVKFTDLTKGQVTKWQWDFGDGISSSEQNPVHTYRNAGVYNVILTVTNDYGISDVTKVKYINAIGGLKSKFMANPNSGKAPLAVKFTDVSIGNPTSWKWDFGDGATSTEQNPTHTFTTGGAFDVKLTISRDIDSDTSTQVVNIGGVPVADFAGTPVSANQMDTIKFTDKSTNSPTSWAWDFGDAATSTEQNPNHVYQLKGVYTVTLTARNDNGKDTETKTSYINIGMSPKADFIPTYAPYEQYKVPMRVSFIDQSINNPTSWSWDFGDGQTSNDQNPIHSYTSEGTYTVSLTVKNAFGTDTKTRKDLITVGKGAAVDFVADKTVVGVGRIVTFTDLSKNSPTDWVWEFGDGSVGTGSKPDHAYRAIGTYDVTLTASNPSVTNTATKRAYITVLNIPRADFVADKTRGGSPLTVKFTDDSSGSPTAWKWDFGDGATSAEQNPQHTYTTLGVYTVSLTASNANGQDTTAKVGYIVTTLAPVADFTADRQQGKAPFIVQFKDISTGNPTKWSWDFGDGTSSSEQNPRHIYLREGAYDVSLTATNEYGSDTMFKSGNAAPAAAQPAVTTTPAIAQTTVAAVSDTPAAPAAPKATPTKSPMPTTVTIAALSIGLLAAVGLTRK
jgi:PKD repeat protein